MPKEVFGADFAFLPRGEILSYEEIARLARVCCDLGVEKIRITGGEPLLRRDLPRLIARLAELPGVDLALTTNGSLLPQQAAVLAAAGLNRVTVSLDSLDDEIFRRMNDVDYPVERVLDGIEAAEAAGLAPVKINAVIQRGVNEHTLVDLAGRFRGTGHIVRFIEYMDVGTTNGWRLDEVVTGAEIVDRMQAVYPIEPIEPAYRGEVARRWSYLDGAGEIGVITSVSRPFCGDCSRARLSTDGKFFTCLFASEGLDLRTPMRAGVNDAGLRALLTDRWSKRGDRYSEERSSETADLDRVEMSYIGG